MNKRRNLGFIPHLCASLTLLASPPLTSHAAAQQLDLGEALRGPLFATQGQLLNVSGTAAGTSIYVGGRKESCGVEGCVIPQSAALGRQTLRFEPSGAVTLNRLFPPKNIYILPSDGKRVKVFLGEAPHTENELRAIDRELAYFNSYSGIANVNSLTINDIDYEMSRRLGKSFSLGNRITPGDLKNIRQADFLNASYPLWAYLSPIEAKVLEKYLKELKNQNGEAVSIGIKSEKPTNAVPAGFFSGKGAIVLPSSISRDKAFAGELIKRYERISREKIAQNTRQLIANRLVAGSLPINLYGINSTAKKNLGFGSYSAPPACDKLKYLAAESGVEIGFYTWLSREYSLGVSIDPTAEPVGGQTSRQKDIETFPESVSKSRWNALISRNYGNNGMVSEVDNLQPVSPAIVFILDTMDNKLTDTYARTVKTSEDGEIVFEGHGKLIKDIISEVNKDAKIKFEAIKICEDGICRMEKLIASVCQAAAVKIGNPKHRVLINMSFSTPMPGKTLRSVIEYAVKEGVEIIASHGNAPKKSQDVNHAEPSGYSCRDYTTGDLCHHFPGDWSKDQKSIISVAPVDCEVGKGWKISDYSRASLSENAAKSVPPSVYFPGSWPSRVTLKGSETFTNYNGSSFATAAATAMLIKMGNAKVYAKPGGRC